MLPPFFGLHSSALGGGMQDTIAIVIIAAVVFFLFFRRGYVYVRAIFDPAYRRRLMKRM
jgi:hypothetical protein